MEGRAILNEANHSLWTSSSIIPVKSISIELIFPTEMPQSTPENIQHSNFSLRGYAEEIKRRNPKASDPFQFDDVPSETTQGPSQSSKEMENVPDANHNIADSDKINQEDTDDDFDDSMPLSQLRKAVISRLTNIQPEVNTNPLDNGDLGHNTLEVDVAPLEVHNTLEHHHPIENVNTAMSDSEDSLEDVPSNTVSRRKAKKLRMMCDILCDEGTKNYNHVHEGDLSNNTGIIGYTEASNSLTHVQILPDDVITDINSSRMKGKMHQEGDGSLGQGTIAEKSCDPVTNGDVVANAPTDASLQIVNRGHSLKRGAEGNNSLVTKKAKLAQIPETFLSTKISERKSASVISGDFKRCSAYNSVGCSSSAPIQSNKNSPYNLSFGETCKIISDVTQIPNFTTMNGGSSRTWVPTLDGQYTGTSTTRNPTGLCLTESVIPPASAQDLLKKRQVLDLNQTETPGSSYALPKGSFLKPKDRDNFQQKILENQGAWKSNMQQCEQRHGKDVVQCSSDDFPLDILELMTKNQLERKLGINAESHLVPHKPHINTIRSFPNVQNIMNMERSTTVGHSGSNARSFMGAEQGNTINYYQNSRNPLNIGVFDERQRTIFNAFQQNQQNISSGRQFSAATSYVRPVQRRSVVLERSSLISSTVFPFGPDSLQKFSTQTHVSSSEKGKTISDIKAGELKSTMQCNHEDYIPAMQLLSLKRERSTSSTFNVGNNRSLDNPLGIQLYSNAEGMRGFLNKSVPLHNNQANRVHNAARPFAFSTGGLFFDPQRQERLREKSQIPRYVNDVSDHDHGQSSSKGKDYKQKGVVVYSDIPEGENNMPLRIDPPSEIFCVNRNPADFTSLEAGKPKKQKNAKGKAKEKKVTEQ